MKIVGYGIHVNLVRSVQQRMSKYLSKLGPHLATLTEDTIFVLVNEKMVDDRDIPEGITLPIACTVSQMQDVDVVIQDLLCLYFECVLHLFFQDHINSFLQAIYVVVDTEDHDLLLRLLASSLVMYVVQADQLSPQNLYVVQMTNAWMENTAVHGLCVQ